MTKPLKIFTGAAIALLLIVFGFGTGLYLKNSDTRKSETEQTVIPNTEQKNTTYNDKIYTVSAPSRGRVNFTVPIVFDNLSGTTGIAYLQKSDGEKITVGKNILLYDGEGTLMDGIGQVKSIAEGKDMLADYIGVSYVILNIPQDKIPARGEIILDSISQANRLPLSALEGGAGEYYLWEAVNEDSKITVVRSPISGVQKINDAFFIMDTPDYKSNTYILDPDATLMEGQIIQTNNAPYSPGYIGNDRDLAAVPQKIYPDRASEEQFLKEAAQNNSCATSCGPGAAATQDFINRVRTLAKEVPKPSGAP